MKTTGLPAQGEPLVVVFALQELGEKMEKVLEALERIEEKLDELSG